MPYFARYFQPEAPVREVQIAVHCDLEVFARLMAYIKKTEEWDNYELFDPKYAIHILVSGHFLQMEPLVEQCLQYCHNEMNAILATPCPLASLSDTILERIAAHFTHREVENLQDTKDKIKSRLYRKLLERMLRQTAVTKGHITTVFPLFKCSLCNKVLATRLQSIVVCKPSRDVIGKRGEISYCHKRDQNWDRDLYLQEQLLALGTWRRVYWHIWSAMNSLQCSACGRHFPLSLLGQCRFHPEPLRFDSGRALQVPGVFPCCGLQCWRYSPLDPLFSSSGCAYKNHTVAASERQSPVYQDFIAFKDVIVPLSPEDRPALAKVVIEVQMPEGADTSTDGEGETEADWPGNLKCVVNPMNDEVQIRAEDLNQPPTLVSVFAVRPTSAESDDKPQEKLIWNPGDSLWHNQDAVRQFDSQNMDLLVEHLQKLRGLDKNRSGSTETHH